MVKKRKISQGIAAMALIFNIFLPGVGSLIGGKTTTGILQLVFYLISVPLMFVLIGFPLMLAMWIWALVTGIQIVKESE